MKTNTKKILVAIFETIIDMTVGSDKKRTEFKGNFDRNLKEVKKVSKTCRRK